MLFKNLAFMKKDFVVFKKKIGLLHRVPVLNLNLEAYGPVEKKKCGYFVKT